MSEKTAVSSRFGGFQQTRRSTRPYRVDTLLNRDGQQKPSEHFEPEHSTQPQEDFEAALASTAGEEFSKEANEVRTCTKQGCDNPADRAVIWADGRGAAICCQDHVKHFQDKLDEVVGVRRYDPDAPKGRQYSSLSKEKTAAELDEVMNLMVKNSSFKLDREFIEEDIPEGITNVLEGTRQAKFVKAVSERPEVHKATGTIKGFFRRIREKDRK